MKIGAYHFRPQLLATLLAIAGVIFLINLGLWQIDRADEKALILQNIDDRKTAQPLSLNQLDKLDDKNYYHLQIKGSFDNAHYLLLDNRFYNGRPGFEVIQAFYIETQDTQRIVLVDRGWIPFPADRAYLPEIPVIEGSIELLGEVYIPTKAIVLEEDQLSSTKPWPQLIQSLDMSKLIPLYNELEMTIEPWIFRQQADQDKFYKRQWIFVSMKPAKHISYAITWFALALALIIIYIAAATSHKENESE